MKLIADSGASKTDWCLVNDKGELVKRVYTKGLNPYHQTTDSIAHEIEMNLMNEIRQHKIKAVYFYGAGCEYDKKEDVRRAIALSINAPWIEVGSDLIAAARSLLGKERGIACILGTGSNSCLYDGTDIVDNITSLGFILDDLGSGSALGREFLKSCFKKNMPKDIADKFIAEYKLTVEILLDRVYKQPQASRFMASVSPFVLEHINVKEIGDIVRKTFREFFEYNIVKYENYQTCKLSFTGSIAYYYADILKEVAAEYGLTIATILQSPMEGLLQYHTRA
ncbi:N-acetylglucosamine kinase-like BadF-type ATPase [Dysgonomonas sp. PH5-45]|uniref:ATPase n=1 Tax=unclassified Dysgonomonas TaxID=2630389 RepID=UPI0024749AA0|nr:MULTISPECIES: ATPase [unclassified Dysgonomonas]MDH6354025.1 N-acetylglucosamine kinase-like BadF-type ATPase [Dysgonomonas sp. PH5-45]MDH6386927.1 N-acetylglucosamine kinase-like BadF-type ATPase [Dysgonomonas sp. PH5-37]